MDMLYLRCMTLTISVFIENMGNFKYEYIFWNGKVKRPATGQYLHEANLSQIHSFINNIKENIQLIEKNKAPVIQYVKTVLEAATVDVEANYCCDHMH